MDYQVWKEKLQRNCSYIVLGAINGFFKDVYDYLKYKGCEVIKVYSDDGDAYNWHFEDTPILSESKICAGDVSGDCVWLVVCGGSTFQKYPEHFCQIETEIVEQENVSEYSDGNGNRIINEAGISIPRLIFYGRDNLVYIGENARIGKGTRMELHGGHQSV